VLLDGDEWRRTFDAFQRDAWRFEAQPTYTMPKETENVARFLRGEPQPTDHNSRWHERVHDYVASGRSIGRVRIVRRPLTDYQRYQFAWGIPGNIQAGEAIRILNVTHDDYGLPISGSLPTPAPATPSWCTPSTGSVATCAKSSTSSTT
jgi:hypothetical protein